MKKITLGILPAIAAAGLVLSGCVCHHHKEEVVPTAGSVTTTRTVIVTEAPPSPQTEVQGTAPAETSVWIQGYWVRVHDRWVWFPGHWESRPSGNAVWVPGHWDATPDGKGWTWTDGYWR